MLNTCALLQVAVGEKWRGELMPLKQPKPFMSKMNAVSIRGERSCLGVFDSNLGAPMWKTVLAVMLTVAYGYTEDQTRKG